LPGDELCRHCKQSLTLFDLPQPENQVERGVMYGQVKSLKHHVPVTVAPTATIGEAIAVMVETNVGALLIVDAAGKLVGIFTERDLLKKIDAHADYEDLPISQFMTPRPECVALTDTLNIVLHKMDVGGYRHVPVLEDGKPVGIVSARDMLRYLTRLCKDIEK
jgi:CBS domain-containing protein